MTEIGAFMVRTKLTSEFEFPAPILQSGTVGTKISSKTFSIHNFMNKFLRYWYIVQEGKTESASM